MTSVIGGLSGGIANPSAECGVDYTIRTRSSVVLEGTENTCWSAELAGALRMSAAVVADECSNDYGHTALGSGDVGDCSHGSVDRSSWMLLVVVILLIVVW